MPSQYGRRTVLRFRVDQTQDRRRRSRKRMLVLCLDHDERRRLPRRWRIVTFTTVKPVTGSTQSAGEHRASRAAGSGNAALDQMQLPSVGSRATPLRLLAPPLVGEIAA